MQGEWVCSLVGKLRSKGLKKKNKNETIRKYFISWFISTYLLEGTIWQFYFLAFIFVCVEGNGNPLQCSCLENPRDGGAWWSAIYGVTQSRTQLKWLSSSKAHLTSYLRMSGSRWMITPLWLSGSWGSFLYSSSVYSYHLLWITYI